MKTIFVNWTKPYFFKEDAQGYNKRKMYDLPNEKFDIVDYELLIQKVAVLRAKKHIGKTKLYTDLVGYNFYKDNDMLKLWDEIDYELLEKFNSDYSNIKPGRFWTSGKSFVMGHEPVPYLFIDLDFIVRGSLPSWIYEYDLVSTQWEIQRGEFFVFKHQIDSIGGIEDFEQNMMMPNTSFVFMNSEKLRDDYLKKHLDLINREYEEIPEWLWLIADQGLLGYSARKLNSKVGTIEDRIYMSYHEISTDRLVGQGPFWLQDPNAETHSEKLNYEHVWFGKHAFKNDPEYREMRMKELREEIDGLLPKLI